MRAPTSPAHDLHLRHSTAEDITSLSNFRNFQARPAPKQKKLPGARRKPAVEPEPEDDDTLPAELTQSTTRAEHASRGARRHAESLTETVTLLRDAQLRVGGAGRYGAIDT